MSVGGWNAAGAAIGEVDGWQFRVAGAHPGETVQAKVDAVSRGAPVLFGHRVKTLESGSIERRKAPCSIHVRCGGCPLITAGTGQFAAKVRSSLEAMPAALRDVLEDEEAWLPSPLEFGYRHKATLLPSWGRGLKLGGYARGTHEVVDQAECAVLAPALRGAGTILHERLQSALRAGRGGVRPPGAKGPDHALRSLVLRANRRGEVLVTAIGWSEAARGWLAPALEDLVGDAISGLHFQAYGGEGDRVHGPDPTERIAGAGRLRELVGDVEITLRPLAFFQVNPHTLERIVPALAARLPADGALIDLYCGGGALGLAICAGTERALVGVERDGRALASAQKDAQRLGVSATWHEGTPEGMAEELPTGAGAVIVDPPRSGLSTAAVEAVSTLDPQRVAYVSCHGPSLSRDTERLAALGWRPTSLLPADMLPQTPHVEWLAVFERG